MLLNLEKTKGRRQTRPLGPFGRRLLVSILLAGFPGVILALALLLLGPYSLDHKAEGSILMLLLWLGLSFSARNMAVHSIRVLSNVVASVKEEDFSFRATQTFQGDALGDLAIEINSLARALETERLGTIETVNLLRQVMAEAGAAILAFSMDGRVRLLNRTGANLLRRHEEQILDRTAQELGIEDLFEGPPTETISRPFADIEKRWIVRRTYFRQHGVQHRLVVLSEASEALRAEERLAWQRIIRVLGHEINNSLAPIKSIARTLGRISSGMSLPADVSENFKQGLEVIGGRADSLNRFLQNYTRLARLPPPTRRIIALEAILARVAGLESRLVIGITPGPDVQVYVDPDQMEQALINLVRNGVEAVLQAQTPASVPDAVTLSWHIGITDLEIRIRDQGIGLPETENLFVPFYTTKQTGSGIGLLLSRQIVEAHGGSLTLTNRKDRTGCDVQVRIPGCVLTGSSIIAEFD